MCTHNVWCSFKLGKAMLYFSGMDVITKRFFTSKPKKLGVVRFLLFSGVG